MLLSMCVVVAGSFLSDTPDTSVPVFDSAESRIKWIEQNIASPLERKHGAKPRTMEEELERLRIPGVSVAVIYDGKIDWAKGYGVRNAQTREPVTTDTLFQAASISKPFAALAALRLVREGKLQLDTDINNSLKEWQVPKSDLGVVTLRNLLSHRGGLSVSGFPGYKVGDPIPSVVQILNGEPPANTPPVVIEKTPGAQFQYSGGGYTVVQLLLTETLQKPFPVLMRELVLDPLNMQHSDYAQPLPEDKWAVAATAHIDGEPIAGRWHIYPELAAAGLWTTPSDLATAAIALQQAKAGNSDVVLDKAGIEQMWTKPGEGPCGLGFALSGGMGYTPSGESAALHFYHTGGNEGFTCALFAYQDHGIGAAIMTNSNSGPKLYQELINTIAAAYDWPG